MDHISIYRRIFNFITCLICSFFIFIGFGYAATTFLTHSLNIKSKIAGLVFGLAVIAIIGFRWKRFKDVVWMSYSVILLIGAVFVIGLSIIRLIEFM